MKLDDAQTARVVITPDNILEPALKALAERESGHYVERWPLISITPKPDKQPIERFRELTMSGYASLSPSPRTTPARPDQPREIVACRAMAITPKGIMIIRNAEEDESIVIRIPRQRPLEIRKMGETRNTEEARKASYERSLQVENGIKSRLGWNLDRFPIHILTVDTKDEYLDQSRAGTGCNVRCHTANHETITKWYREVSEGRTQDQELIDEAWLSLLPNMPVTREKKCKEETLAYAVGAEKQINLNDIIAPSARIERNALYIDEQLSSIRLAGEMLALRHAVQSTHPMKNVRNLGSPEQSLRETTNAKMFRGGIKNLRRARDKMIKELIKQGNHGKPRDLERKSKEWSPTTNDDKGSQSKSDSAADKLANHVPLPSARAANIQRALTEEKGARRDD